MFVGRSEELKKMQALYERETFQCVVIYGRRRVGKTTLINQFLAGKEAAYFMGLESNEKENLEGLSTSIFSSLTGVKSSEASFDSFEAALVEVFQQAEKRQVVLAIDEYPYLAATYKGISSLLQKLIDQYQDNSRLYLILCGSSLSFMENQVLGYASPLFGRRTAQFRINPFEFSVMKEYYSKFSMEDLVLIYGITGGIPQYMKKIDESLSVEDNIKENFFDPSSYLFEEPTNLVKQECREPAQYNAIIKAIATGASRLSEIASKVGLETALCSNYISTLISLGIVKKELPAGTTTGKKTIYSLEDFMFRFWYQFVPENMALIQKGQKDLVYRKIANQIPAFAGKVFEEICRQWLWEQNIKGSLPFLFSDAGRWWGTDSVRKKEVEIDVLAFDGDQALLAECKWREEKTDLSALLALEEKSSILPYKKKYLYLFSKSGFTKGCEERAAETGAVLICFSDMHNQEETRHG